MIDLDKLFRKLRYEKPKNRYEGKYSYSEMITFADSAIKEQQLINKNDCITDVTCRLSDEDITKLSFQEFPVNFITTGDNPEEWDENEQYRVCWVDGYKYLLNGG